MKSLLKLSARRTVPVDYRKIFVHLYLDVVWAGILNGSAIAFIAIYLSRIGSDVFEIGLLTAGPAAVALVLALPAGWWLSRRPLTKSVFWSSVALRSFYLLWILVPSLLPAVAQRWTFVVMTFVMSIPGTALAVGFNALYGEAVPSEWRAHVAGVRNGILSLTTLAASLLCGRVLTWLPMPTAYQVVFGIGFLGAALSSVHLYFVRPVAGGRPAAAETSLGDLSQPGLYRPAGDGTRHGVGLRFLTRGHPLRLPQVDILRGQYGRVMFCLLILHFAQYLAIPLVPVLWVQHVHLSDSQISLGNAIMYVCVFLGSTQLAGLSRRLGHHKATVLGAGLMFLYPALAALTRDMTLFLLTCAAGGLVWSVLGGALGNYVLERVPADNRPAYLAWYNVSLNAAVLVASMVGPLLAREWGIPTALAISAVGRLLSGLILWRWGR